MLYKNYNCSSLKEVNIPKSLTSIPAQAFFGCGKLKEIWMPTSIESIGSSAFNMCSSLEFVMIPSSVKSIGSGAFSGCGNLKEVYTWTVEPTSIGQTTFSNWQTATLYIPEQAHDNYYFNTQWSQFLHLAEFDKPYEYFYLTRDLRLNNQTGVFAVDEENGLSVDMEAQSGLILEGDAVQEITNLTLKSDGKTSASVITNGDNIKVDKITYEISVKVGTQTSPVWNFFSFPFDVELENVSLATDSRWIFRKYDGEKRAADGTGWVDLAQGETTLKAGQGYIFSCEKVASESTNTLIIVVNNPEFASESVETQLVSIAAENTADASWNFVGNPVTSYYNVDDMQYDAPVTIWDGTKYVAVTAEDDDYVLSPFQAFFVQTPKSGATVNFNPAEGLTYNEKEAEAAKKAELAAADVSVANTRAKAYRNVINLNITDGTNDDMTRIVFNDDHSFDYELSYDASKFFSEAPIQLYTLDSKQTKYAINDRPNGSGEVKVGFVAKADGEYTISASRMDVPMVLIDNETKTTHDLSVGGYTFKTSQGAVEDRFVIAHGSIFSGIEEVLDQTGIQIKPVEKGIEVTGLTERDLVGVFSASGAKIAVIKEDGHKELASGAYIIYVNGRSTKVIIK